MGAVVWLFMLHALPFVRSTDMYCGTSSCYALLGVGRAASLAQIRKGYRAASLQAHPDKSKPSVKEAAVLTAPFGLCGATWQ